VDGTCVCSVGGSPDEPCPACDDVDAPCAAEGQTCVEGACVCSVGGLEATPCPECDADSPCSGQGEGCVSAACVCLDGFGDDGAGGCAPSAPAALRWAAQAPLLCSGLWLPTPSLALPVSWPGPADAPLEVTQRRGCCGGSLCNAPGGGPPVEGGPYPTPWVLPSGPTEVPADPDAPTSAPTPVVFGDTDPTAEELAQQLEDAVVAAAAVDLAEARAAAWDGPYPDFAAGVDEETKGCTRRDQPFGRLGGVATTGGAAAVLVATLGAALVAALAV